MKFIIKEKILATFLFLLILLSFIYPYKIGNYPYFVDWKTITALAGLLIITTGLKESGYFYQLSKRFLIKLKNEKKLALFLVILSALLSTFLTNDITLFITVPLTLSFQKILSNEIEKVVIFEAIAVNIGSLLTPIGNPQNMFLWHRWNISFAYFIVKMFPLFALLLAFLILFTFFVFPNKELKPMEKIDAYEIRKKLLIISSFLLIAYLFALQFKAATYFLPVIFIIYILLHKDVLTKVDWVLLLTFLIMFIDFRLISEIKAIATFIGLFNPSIPKNIFLLSIALSQIMSNVPASIFLSKFSNEWFAIIYGVNVGGNGIAIASFANIIALRMMKKRKIWLDFHKYSLAYLFMSSMATYIIFFL